MSGATTGQSSSSQEQHEFQADVARLLHLMVHSIYSDREIFLRELISNAADACEKLRYEALSDSQLLPEGHRFSITIASDKTAKTLSITDNGIGMNREELIASLGSIASSGTRAFMEKFNKPAAAEDQETEGGAANALNLIGQFGIGFYSSFIAASSVDVLTRRAGDEQCWRWTSQGTGQYTIEPVDDPGFAGPGTKIILHLRDDAVEFLESFRLESIIRKYSRSITVPVSLTAEREDAKEVADGKAIWTKPKSEISTEEYNDFYREIARSFDEPELVVHWRAEGRYEYTVLAFIPGAKPFDLFDPERKDHSRLYVKRVLISDDINLLPGWLRFVRLVVDAPDIDLNVSREIIQQTPALEAIRKAIVNRLISELSRLASNDSEKFAKIWKNFGAVIKEGLYEDATRRDQLYDICRFATTAHPDGMRSLKDYVSTLRENQTAIFYIAGENAEQLKYSPHLEGFRNRGVEVLLLSDPVDSFWVSNALGYDGKPFKSVTQGDYDLSAIPLAGPENQDAPAMADESALAVLISFMKQTLGDAASDVRASNRLAESPACLIAADNALDRRLEKILSEHGQLQTASRPVLEINPSHPFIAALAAGVSLPASKQSVEDSIWLLFDEARMMDGEKPLDGLAFRQRLFRVLSRSVEAGASA